MIIITKFYLYYHHLIAAYLLNVKTEKIIKKEEKLILMEKNIMT